MKKFTVAVLIIGAFVLYSLLYIHANGTALAPTSSSSGSSSSGTSSDSTSTSGSSGTNAHYKDGSYTGSMADAQWGYIQVKAIIKGGKITDVQFLQYPNDRSQSQEINSYADSQLTSEAIQAQSSNVDIITGATDSSEAFIQSLSGALAKAQ